MTSERPLLIAHLSDLHLDGGAESWSRTAAVMASIGGSRTPLDSLVITGDITDGSSPAMDAQLEQLLTLLPTDVPLVCCSGNTDDAASIHRIRQHPATSLTTPGLSILPIDCETGAPARLRPRSLAQARARLAALTTDDRALLALHHPPAPLHGTVGDQLLLQAADDLVELAEHPAVIGILAGHTHSATVSARGAAPLLIAPGVRSEGRLPHIEVTDYEDALVDDRANPAYLLHRVEGRTITSYARQVPLTPTDSSPQAL
ncbi:metallophosphoesterase [Microcella daejeonensis]|uniref:Metallophosphoesterase n=1 Tax=Microcella daejeonensis TaxID=2994971 RepID=A0A9E8S8J3_9MICO|nr:metallophosphoesterase [Microcella daejeonensis]WAB81293.1 metallophosphoesterase [Microcella daejeonensis]